MGRLIQLHATIKPLHRVLARITSILRSPFTTPRRPAPAPQRPTLRRVPRLPQSVWYLAGPTDIRTEVLSPAAMSFGTFESSSADSICTRDRKWEAQVRQQHRHAKSVEAVLQLIQREQRVRLSLLESSFAEPARYRERYLRIREEFRPASGRLRVCRTVLNGGVTVEEAKRALRGLELSQ